MSRDVQQSVVTARRLSATSPPWLSKRLFGRVCSVSGGPVLFARVHRYLFINLIECATTGNQSQSQSQSRFQSRPDEREQTWVSKASARILACKVVCCSLDPAAETVY